MADGESSGVLLLDLTAELDLEAIHVFYHHKDSPGEKAYNPQMQPKSSARRLVVLLPYAHGVGLPSSHKIENAWWEGAAFRGLTGNQPAAGPQPDPNLPPPPPDFSWPACFPGAAAAPEGGAAAPGAWGARRHQAQAERQQAQGQG